MTSNYFRQYIAGYIVANFWRYPIWRRVTKSSALECNFSVGKEWWKNSSPLYFINIILVCFIEKDELNISLSIEIIYSVGSDLFTMYIINISKQDILRGNIFQKLSLAWIAWTIYTSHIDACAKLSRSALSPRDNTWRGNLYMAALHYTMEYGKRLKKNK